MKLETNIYLGHQLQPPKNLKYQLKKIKGLNNMYEDVKEMVASYTLCAMIFHYEDEIDPNGNITGRFYMYIMDWLTGQWFCVNDNVVTKVQTHILSRKSNKPGNLVYMLYVKQTYVYHGIICGVHDDQKHHLHGVNETGENKS